MVMGCAVEVGRPKPQRVAYVSRIPRSKTPGFLHKHHPGCIRGGECFDKAVPRLDITFDVDHKTRNLRLRPNAHAR
ncbi:TPA_asm: UL20.4 dORF 2 [Human alphaherpesvirus 1]|nr:TPA_asm: UL20.4 dORF 2 [Human alphaherpesvirus 1]